jgi:hypothetical protein
VSEETEAIRSTRMADDVIEGGIGDFKAKLQGSQTIYIALLAVSLGITGWMLWNDVRENRSASHSEHTSIQQGIDEMVYVQSLSDEERKRLNLTMPDTLAKKRKSAWTTDH